MHSDYIEQYRLFIPVVVQRRKKRTEVFAQLWSDTYHQAVSACGVELHVCVYIYSMLVRSAIEVLHV